MSSAFRIGSAAASFVLALMTVAFSELLWKYLVVMDVISAAANPLIAPGVVQVREPSPPIEPAAWLTAMVVVIMLIVLTVLPSRLTERLSPRAFLGGGLLVWSLIAGTYLSNRLTGIPARPYLFVLNSESLVAASVLAIVPCVVFAAGVAVQKGRLETAGGV